jgi:hypothetical protein
MEHLLERLEGVVDNLARDDYEVDYSVRADVLNQ